MKKIVLAVAALSLIGGAAFADPVHDWHGLERARHHIAEAKAEIDKLAAANDHNMGGHANAAENLLNQADQQLRLAIEARKQAK